MEKQSKIICPQCGTEIDVQDVLTHQLEKDLKNKFNLQLAEEKKKFDQQAELLKQEKEAFEQKKEKENELFNDRLQAKLKEEKQKLSQDLKSKIQAEQAEQFSLLQQELNEKSEQVKQLNKTRAEIEKLKREKEELKESIEAELQKNLNIKLSEEKEKIRKTEEEKNELKIKELQKQLDDQKRLTEEMKRKQEQGSMQLQGEVQELAIEEWLSAKFPLDNIEEIKKGVRGGDCIQIVNSRHRQNCGIIYYESKRTKDFQPGWIEKFKADIREKKADIGVLVTNAMPPDMERMGPKDGIWICTFEEFKGLCFALRETLIRVSTAISTQENKGDKMALLYDFLTSNTFRLQMEAIVEGFSQMKEDLESEKRAMQRIWKTREKQIEKVITNTIDMYGSIKGIAGNAIGTLKSLEFPMGNELEE